MWYIVLSVELYDRNNRMIFLVPLASSSNPNSIRNKQVRNMLQEYSKNIYITLQSQNHKTSIKFCT